jgi:hypothetical protein
MYGPRLGCLLGLMNISNSHAVVRGGTFQVYGIYVVSHHSYYEQGHLQTIQSTTHGTILVVCLQVNPFFYHCEALFPDAAFRSAQRLVARRLMRATAKRLVGMGSEVGDVVLRSMLLCTRKTSGKG